MPQRYYMKIKYNLILAKAKKENKNFSQLSLSSKNIRGEIG